MNIKKQETAITKQDITNLEKKYSFQFPESLKNFLLKNNGGIPEKTLLVKKGINFLIDKLLSVKYGKYNTYESTLDSIADIIPSYTIPFAIDPFGNYFVFKKKINSIFFLDMEDVTLTSLNKDFKTFIDALIYDEEEDNV